MCLTILQHLFLNIIEIDIFQKYDELVKYVYQISYIS